MNIKEEMSNFKAMVNSYKLTNLIIAANNIGIFNCLTERDKNIEQIAKKLEVMSNRIEPILNGLVFYKIISKNENGYYLDEYKDVLLKGSKFNQTGYINFAQTIMKKYNNLENAIKNNELSTSNFEKLTDEQAESFVEGMQANAIPQAEYIASKYDFENHRILDIGAGAGTYLINVSKKYKSVTGTMIDLPQVSKIQNRNIEKEKLQDRLKSVSCDYNKDFPDGFYDAVFLFAVVHQEPDGNLKRLLNNIYSVLKPNGRLFLTSFFLNDDKISPEFSVQFAIEMIVSSQNGKVYTHREINDLLKDCNFSNIEIIDEIPSPATLYIAQK
ncbi:MAG: methyltransferase domain-containing protein [Clostridia bacterium]|nr:methyltransferase domain-containing protein [Clostridia bacterium]